MRTKIFVMTHKKFHPPHDEIYIPLQVGRVLGEDLGYLGDDTGETHEYFIFGLALFWSKRCITLF